MHVGTFVGVNLEASIPIPFALHFVVVALGFISVGLEIGGPAPTEGRGEDHTKLTPEWMKVLIAVLIPYVFFNFFYTGSLNENGSPIVTDDGQQALWNHGIIRTLSDEEFRTHTLYTIRMFSGHWMGLYGFLMVSLYTRFAMITDCLGAADVRQSGD